MVYIWIRSTGNWHDEEAFLAQVQARFRPTLAVWHETFQMPYHRFRGRVSEIARASLAGVRGARVAEWEEIPDGALVLPVDDDDWFAPHAAEVLERERRPGAAAYVWPAEFAETPMWLGHRIYLARRRLLPATPAGAAQPTATRWRSARAAVDCCSATCRRAPGWTKHRTASCANSRTA